jgi:hypothetical protein
MNDEERREAAIERLKAKRDFKTHVAVYLIVNGMLVAIWALSGVGYFWPIWPILGWGVGLAFNGWAVYLQRPITEADIREEMESDDRLDRYG